MNKRTKTIIGLVVAIVTLTLIIGIVSNSKVIYTKEFAYLPQCKEIQLQTSEPIKENQFGNAIYKVTGERYDKYLKKYEKILKKDGWEITKDEKPANIEVKKNEHIARINVVDSKDSLTVLIWTK